jgi:hypothetical protein
LHTVHTNKKNCSQPNPLIKCYSQQINGNTINRTNIGNNSWEIYHSASDINMSNIILGEFNEFSGDGFTLDLDPDFPKLNYSKMFPLTNKTFFD